MLLEHGYQARRYGNSRTCSSTGWKPYRRTCISWLTQHLITNQLLLSHNFGGLNSQLVGKVLLARSILNGSVLFAAYTQDPPWYIWMRHLPSLAWLDVAR